jgi:hypothetical protein
VFARCVACLGGRKEQFPVPSLNVVSKNPVLNAVYWTKTRGPRFTVDRNSGERCDCRHAKKFPWRADASFKNNISLWNFNIIVTSTSWRHGLYTKPHVPRIASLIDRRNKHLPLYSLSVYLVGNIDRYGASPGLLCWTCLLSLVDICQVVGTMCSYTRVNKKKL